MNALPELVVTFRRDAVQRARILAEHAPGEDGRCPVCRPGGDGSGRSHGCALWAAAVEAGRQLGS